MVVIGLLVGGTAGTLGMALFAGRSYEKGWKDGFKQAMEESKKIVEDKTFSFESDVNAGME